MSSSRSDHWIIALLVIALIAQTLLLLWHMGLVSFRVSDHDSLKGEQYAGVIVRSENKLRRRPLNSLVWENSRIQDSVYFYDSLLTLSQSTAKLELSNGTHVILSENTLVTLEPPEEQRQGEIRLKFTKGSLKARNKFSKAKIEGEQFTIDLKADSELELHQTGEDDFEIQVKKGEATLTSESGKEMITQDKLLKISSGESQAFKLSEAIQWEKLPAPRIYTHKKLVGVSVSWKGSPSTLNISRKGSEKKSVSLPTNSSSLDLKLPHGEHRLVLESKDSLSQPFNIQVWQAPVVHLIQPLPRNRVRTEDVHFLWTRWPEAKEYVLQVQGQKYDLNQPVSANNHTLDFDNEDDARWTIWAKDSDGHLIPPLYDYPIFIRKNPFEAPKLNEPILREPAKEEVIESSGFWQLLLFPKAHAQRSSYEAVFSWQAVQGADRYWIEISETKDFRTPIVQTTTKETQFIWKGVAKQKSYFWRVAAGNSSGRMGLFTPPTPVRLKVAKAKPKPKPKPQPKPIVKPKPRPKPDPKKKADVVQALPSEEEVQGPKTKILWRGGYGLLQLESPSQVSADLSGLMVSSLSIERKFFTGRNRWWEITGKYTQAQFSPDPKSKFPFQPDITVNQAELSALSMNKNSRWGWGGTMNLIPELNRVSFEKVENKDQLTMGPQIRALWTWSDSEYQMDSSLLIGSGIYGVVNTHQYLFRPWFPSLIVGLEGQLSYLMGDSRKYFGVQTFFTVGFEF